MFTMDDILEIAIKMEENAEAIYTDAIEKTHHNELKSRLAWMAKEERAHARWFEELKNSFSLKIDEARLKKIAPQVLQDMMGEKTLALEYVNFTTIKTASELLETFIHFENDTILFYELLEVFIQEEAVLNGLKKIMIEEKTHIETLRSMMVSLSEQAI